jgi:RNA polymerase sigma-70 factor (ECF subfamily)
MISSPSLHLCWDGEGGKRRMKNMSNGELISQLQCGKLSALGELYNRHRRMVYQTAIAITGDREAANDLLQDVFLRLHRFVNHFDPNRPLEPWLYRMTANLSYSWVKRNHRGRRILKEVTEWFLGSSAEEETPHSLAEEKDEWEQVQRALLSLPIQQRVVVVMYYLNDLSLQEISQTLDVPLGTVKSRLHYGRLSLQHSLELQVLTGQQQMPAF